MLAMVSVVRRCSRFVRTQLLQPPGHRCRPLLKFARPDYDDLPPKATKLLDDACVALAIRLELRLPEGPVALGDCSLRTTAMAVPKTAVNEHAPAPSDVHDVGRAGEPGLRAAGAKPQAAHQRADLKLWPGALLANEAEPARGGRVGDQVLAARLLAHAAAESSIRRRCFRMASRKPGGNLSVLSSARRRNPAVPRADNGVSSSSRKSAR